MRVSLLAATLVLTAGAALAECPTPPLPQRDIIADSYYDDPPVYSHIDPVRHADYEAAVKPLEAFLQNVAKMASGGDKVCAVRWLVAWAEADAMLGKIEKEQANYERKWLLAGLALSYAKVRDGASSDQRAAIDNWLLALADGVRNHSDAYKGTRNNHYYWEGLAVGATGAVTGNEKDLAWARKVFHDTENDIADNGILPLEMKRGARALHYHLFAAAPLVMLESILDIQSQKVGELVRYCDNALGQPEIVTMSAGAAQIGILKDDNYWLGIFWRHHRRNYFDNGVKRPDYRPYVARLGGDLSKANPLEHVGK